MRTTVEIKPGHRAKLLELAAKRGEKGFSSVVGEAIESYLLSVEKSDQLRNKALRLRGVLSHAEVERLRRSVGQIRSFWR
jgi:hypothetical protein